MALNCPKCSKQLPEVEKIEYRFCPHCGAEIAAESRQLDEVYLTIPPDSPPPPAGQPPVDLSQETEKKIAVTDPFNDQTSAPQPMANRQKPKLKPPDTPPPNNFFRTHSAEKTHPIRSGKKDAPKKDIKKQPPTQNRKIIIVTLVILAMIILLLGGLFTF